MIYKFKDGGVIKLQNAGSLPKWMQKLNSWSSKNIPQSDESIGERIQNKTIEEANSAKTQEERDKIYKDSAKTNLAVTGQSLMMLPMLGEFTTYGLLGGGLRIGTGMAGSKAGEYVLGKGGDWADKQLNTNFLGTTGRIIGGLGGWWGGSSATTPLFRNLAGKGITLHIPQETFMHLRGQYFDRAANKAFAKASPNVVQMNIESGKIGWAPSVNKIMWHNSNDPISQLDINYPAWDVVEKNAPLGHSWLTGLETTQGFLGERPYHLRSKIDLNKPMVQIGEAIGDGKNTTRNQILDFAQKSSADGINFQGIADNTLKNQDVYAVFKGVDLSPSKIILEPDKYWYVGHQTSSINFPSIHKNGLHTTNGLSGTATLVNQNFIDEFLNGNLKKLHLSHEGSNGLVLMKFPKDKFPKADLDDISFRLMDLGESSDFEVPSKYMTFLKQEQESPFSIDPVIKPIDPQEAATTYHFDGRMPLSKPISEFERNGKYTLDELHQMGFKLPRKHLQGNDAVRMFKEYGTQYPETTRLYRITGTSGKFVPSPDGTAEFAGQWFTNDPRKGLLYGSRTAKQARKTGVENPIELQVVDIPNSQLERYRASNILKGRTNVEYEPTEDFLIPLDMPRGRAPMNFTGNALLDNKVELPNIPVQDTQLMQQLRKYVPEARERYGLVGNTNITDDEIAGSLYKKALELGGNTAAVNEFGEPLVLFRGDTKRYNALRKVVSPEELKNGRGSMDNSFGNLFLGQLDGPGEGVERYIHYVHQFPSGATDVYPSATGERLIWNGNKIREQGAPISIPEKYLTYDLRKPFKRYGEQVRVRKISSELASPNSNDINAFVVRTPAVRNSSSEISPEMGGEFINVDGVPKFKNSNYVDREQAAFRIRQILDDAELKNQGLLKSDAYSPLRENEHFEFDYYALPNFNIRGAKHILPFDLRIPTQWNSRIIYRKQGGIIKGQNSMKIPESATSKAYFSGLKDYLFHTTKSFIPSKYRPTKGNDIKTQYYTRPGLKEEVALSIFGGTDKNAKGILGDRNYFYKDFDDAYNQIINTSTNLEQRVASNGTLGNYMISAGEDNGRRYLSFIDKFDHVIIPGKPIPIYDRIYEDEIDSLYNKNRSAFNEGDWITRSPILNKLKKKNRIIKGQNGRVIGWSPIPFLTPKWMFELVAKRSNGAQTKSIPTIIKDVITGRDKSFYNYNNINGSNEIDTYLYGVPYNSEFTGDVSVGPDYTNYINKNYPNRNIKTYNAHFGDTLYIDDKAKPLVEKQLNNGEVVGGSMGRYAHAPSYIVTTEEGRPYDAGGHLMKFSRDKDGNIVANMSDIYDFLSEDFNDKYNQTENPSWTRNLANNIGTPFIVRQNNIPVRFKEIVPEYKTNKQRELGEFLSQWGNTYDLKLPLSLSDEQIQEIFDGRDYGDDILDFMISKGYIKPVYKSGGIVKGQNGFLNTWQKAYNSKFGKGLRDFMFGKDGDLSDEEYLKKYGYNKPVGGIGVLGALVAPEWEGLEIPEITAQHVGNQGKVLRWFESGNSKMLKVPIKETSKKVSNWQKFLKLSQQEQDDFVRRWNGESFQGFSTLKGDKQSLSKFRSWINSRK